MDLIDLMPKPPELPEIYFKPYHDLYMGDLEAARASIEAMMNDVFMRTYNIYMFGDEIDGLDRHNAQSD